MTRWAQDTNQRWPMPTPAGGGGPVRTLSPARLLDPAWLLGQSDGGPALPVRWAPGSGSHWPADTGQRWQPATGTRWT